MSTVQRLFWAHMLAAVAALAIGYARAGIIVAALVFVFLGATWFTAQQRGGGGRPSTERSSADAAGSGGGGMEDLLFFIFIAAAAVGLWLGVPGWLLLIAVVATMGAWDLDHFLQRLSGIERVEFDTGLGREHLRRLGLVEGVGLASGLFALTARMKIPFWWEALLIFLAVIGIRVVIWFVRKQMDK